MTLILRRVAVLYASFGVIADAMSAQELVEGSTFFPIHTSCSDAMSAQELVEGSLQYCT